MRSEAPALMPIFRSQHQAALLAWLLLHPDDEYTLTDLAKRLARSVRVYSSSGWRSSHASSAAWCWDLKIGMSAGASLRIDGIYHPAIGRYKVAAQVAGPSSTGRARHCPRWQDRNRRPVVAAG